MRQEDERNLVGLANDILCRFCRMGLRAQGDDHLFYGEVVDRDPKWWQPIGDFIANLKNEKLGVIIALRPAKWEEYKTAHYLQTPPVVQLIDTSICRSGHDQLVKLATPVIIAAMYDILMTQNVIEIEQGAVAQSVTYVPKKAMRTFVLKHRLNQSSVKA